MLKKALLIITTTLLLAAPFAAAAQSSIPKPNTLPGVNLDFSTPQGRQEAKNFLPTYFAPRLTSIFIGFSAVVAFFALVYAGILYVTAYGREDQVGNAKKIAIWALVGLVIALFAYSIVSIVIQLKLIT